MLGETFYLAETREGAYAEVLAPFKRANGSTDPLAKDAAALGMTLEEFVEEVARDWADRDFMGLGAVPAGWRYDRGMFRVEMIGSAELVHIEHPDSIAAIELLMGEELAHLGVSHLTTATLRSENRAVTTAIATALRAQLLDSGALPRGIHFGSKHGAAWCNAYWIDTLTPGDLLPLSPEPVLVTDEALKTVADRFRIRVF